MAKLRVVGMEEESYLKGIGSIFERLMTKNLRVRKRDASPDTREI